MNNNTATPLQPKPEWWSHDAIARGFPNHVRLTPQQLANFAASVRLHPYRPGYVIIKHPEVVDAERETKQLRDALKALGAEWALPKAGGTNAPAEEAPLSLDEICAQAGVDRAEYERVRAAAGLPPHGSLGETPFDVRAPAYAFAVSRGHSHAEAEAFAQFVDKHFDAAAVGVGDA